MKKIFICVAALGSLFTAAFADQPTTTPPAQPGANASACGAAHGAFAPVNGGNFGFIGQEFQGAPNYHGGIQGQEPGATGYNNSHSSCQTNNPNLP
jgi:hypothetical protein